MPENPTPTYFVAKGFTLKFDNVSVGSVSKIGGVEVSTDTVDTTAVTDNDGYKSFMGTYHDAGEIEIEWFCKASDSGQDAIAEAMDDGDRHDVEIVFPAAMAKKWTFEAVVTKYKMGEAAVGDLIKGSASFKISGKPTLAAATD